MNEQDAESADGSPHASDERWMREALIEADCAASHADVPVGCVVVDKAGQVLAREHNRREERGDPTAHAELLALRAAAGSLGHWRLEGATVFVTLEPCPMCAGALVNARVARLVYGATDRKAGAVHSLFEIGTDARLNHRFQITGGVLATEGAERLSAFFAKLRASHAQRAAALAGAPYGASSVGASPASSGEVALLGGEPLESGT